MLRLWRDERMRAILFQVALIGGLAAVFFWGFQNARAALDARGISTGLGFLFERAGFDLSESVIPYGPNDTFLDAFLAGLGNTVFVSVAAIVLATVLGIVIGLARLSPNPLLSRLAAAYVELFRNTPQLVQIVFWYSLAIALPRVRDALDFGGGVFLSNRGLTFPWIGEPAVGNLVASVLGLSFLATLILVGLPGRRRWRGTALLGLWGVTLGVVVLGALTAGLERPALTGFNFRGGATLSPEFLALFLGLGLYIAAFMAEIVRAGLLSVDRGQIEAARTLGLPPRKILASVRIPQALRVIVPPAAAQYISLIKNSSLGVAIGYPELFNISNSIATLSGQAIEAVTIMGCLYLATALGVSAIANAYNRVVQVTER
ncbi:MAG: ABC transporter permease subunit [Pseudomonadota bacterium]